MDDAGIALFIRYPEPGRVKTRLAAVLGDDAAAELYKNFVLDLLDELNEVPAKLLVFYDQNASETEQDMRKWLGRSLELLPQSGSNLGARMEHAFNECFELGLKHVALMGSDVPDYPAPLVKSALDELKRRDVVLGPALDGGYYLIGFSKETYQPQVFHDIPWGTGEVYKTTVNRLQEKGLSILRLPDWIDVDTIRDLNGLWWHNRNTSFNQSRTYKLLKKYENVLAQYDLEPADSLDDQGRPRDEASRGDNLSRDNN